MIPLIFNVAGVESLFMMRWRDLYFDVDDILGDSQNHSTSQTTRRCTVEHRAARQNIHRSYDSTIQQLHPFY